MTNTLKTMKLCHSRLLGRGLSILRSLLVVLTYCSHCSLFSHTAVNAISFDRTYCSPCLLCTLGSLRLSEVTEQYNSYVKADAGLEMAKLGIFCKTMVVLDDM